LELRKIVASSLRQNMLKVLSEKHEIQVMRLVSSVGSTYNEVSRNLMILEKEGLITNEYPIKVRHGRVRVIRLNRENPNVAVLLGALKSLDQDGALGRAAKHAS
jgi:predicted transcriptional regulator